MSPSAPKSARNIPWSLVIAGVTALVAIGLLVRALAGGGSSAPMTPEAIAARLAPVGTVTINAPAPTPAAAPAATAAAPVATAATSANAGAALYQQACIACHAAGVAGAPKLGDKAAWAPRIAQSLDTLTKNAIVGKNAMPPRGTAVNASDAEIRAAVEYMVTKSR